MIAFQHFMALMIVLSVMLVSFISVCLFTALVLTAIALLVDRVIMRILPLFGSNEVK